jgi:hypothetical protein
MKKIIAIHGGSCWASYDEYLADLKESKFDPERLMSKGWKDNLQDALGGGFEVLNPEMPNWWNAHYEEWKIWFEKVMGYAKEADAVIGHSLGGIFLSKYLSENDPPKGMKAAFLVAAPFKTLAKDADFGDFLLPDDVKKLDKLGKRLHIYHSEDDPVVDFSNFNEYAKALPDASTKVFKDRSHFIGSEFPEIVAEIRSVCERAGG